MFPHIHPNISLQILHTVFHTFPKVVNESDPRSDVYYLGSSENKAWKKFRTVRDLNLDLNRTLKMQTD